MNKVALTAVAVLGFMYGSSSQAQFHNKDQNGQVVVNQQAQTNALAQKSKAQIGRGLNSGMLQGSAMYLSEWAVEKGYKLGEMGSRASYILGQTVKHSDGRYTETKRETLASSFEKSTEPIVQTTFSPEGVELAKRTVTFNEYGNPKEVIIRDPKGNFKYRGLLVYDPMSHRLREEQIYDVNNTLLRRNIQKYDSTGARLPNEIYDYVENVPDDLELVVTQAGQEEKEEPRKKMFQFSRKNKESAPPVTTGNGVTTGPVEAPKDKKGLLQIFGGKNHK